MCFGNDSATMSIAFEVTGLQFLEDVSGGIGVCKQTFSEWVNPLFVLHSNVAFIAMLFHHGADEVLWGIWVPHDVGPDRGIVAL
ncbi:hypothetical protein D3C86_1753430 [compost metagenome]